MLRRARIISTEEARRGDRGVRERAGEIRLRARLALSPKCQQKSCAESRIGDTADQTSRASLVYLLHGLACGDAVHFACAF